MQEYDRGPAEAVVLAAEEDKYVSTEKSPSKDNAAPGVEGVELTSDSKPETDLDLAAALARVKGGFNPKELGVDKSVPWPKRAA